MAAKNPRWLPKCHEIGKNNHYFLLIVPSNSILRLQFLLLSCLSVACYMNYRSIEQFSKSKMAAVYPKIQNGAQHDVLQSNGRVASNDANSDIFGVYLHVLRHK